MSWNVFCSEARYCVVIAHLSVIVCFTAYLVFHPPPYICIPIQLEAQPTRVLELAGQSHDGLAARRGHLCSRRRLAPDAQSLREQVCLRDAFVRLLPCPHSTLVELALLHTVCVSCIAPHSTCCADTASYMHSTCVDTASCIVPHYVLCGYRIMYCTAFYLLCGYRNL